MTVNLTAWLEMRVVVDSRTLMSKSPRGTGKAFLEVYRRLPKICEDWSFVFVARDQQAGCSLLGENPNTSIRVADLRGDRFGLWESLQLPITAKRANADVLHCPANTGPRWAATPVLVTVHDLIPIQPEFRSPGWIKWAKRVGRIVRQARVVTTPSEFSRAQIIEEFGVSEKKVISIPWAANSGCIPLAQGNEWERIRRNYKIEPDQPYVLAFGAEDTRKNTRRILEAWSKLAPGDRRDAVLLVVGLQEDFRDKLLRSGYSGTSDSSMRLHGYVAEEDVPGLIAGAEFLCFPTLFEGFGLPILDAFACQSAVLTSRNSSIPEVAGDAALYVDPYCADSIARGIAELLGDAKLREQLVDTGRIQAQKFNWDQCARQYRDAFDTINNSAK